MISIPPQHERLSVDTTQFRFREVRTAQELRDVLALRYRVYGEQMGLKHLSSLDHASRLDADVYDLTSSHFGLFAHSANGETVVGTLRIASERLSPQISLLRAVAAAHPTMQAHLGAARTAPLPMLSYLEQAPAVLERYERLVSAGASVAEPGRLTVAHKLRVAAGRKGLRLSYFIVECALAFGWHVDGLDQVFLDCDVALEPLYRRFGFEPVPDAGATIQPTLGIGVSVLQATPNSLPAGMRERVSDLARQFRDEGEAAMDSIGAPAATPILAAIAA